MISSDQPSTQHTRPAGGVIGEALKLRHEPSSLREQWASRLATRVEAPMALLGLIFLLVVLGQDLASTTRLSRSFAAASWVLWAVFVGEFALRLYVAPRRRAFLTRNWWQVLFLLLPFLRVLRLVQALRLLRAGRVLSSAVRGSRSAGMLVRSRVGWLAMVSVIVVLASSQLLFVLDVFSSYGAALHAAALAALTGEPLRRDSPAADVIEVLLAGYSVVVVAALAAAVGAFFLENRGRSRSVAE